MEIKTLGKMERVVEINLVDVLKELRVKLGFCNAWNTGTYEIATYENIRGIYYTWSFFPYDEHGEYMYDDEQWVHELISNKEEDFEAFTSLNYLIEYLSSKFNGGK